MMDRLRRAFSVEHALQCGYCTPGMLVTAWDIVNRLPDADDDTIRLELGGNLCRCTGYNGIIRAIRRVLDKRLAVERTVAGPLPVRAFGAVQVGAAPLSAPGQEGLKQVLRFAQPADRVWEALQDPALMAGCIPGAEISSAIGNRIEGTLKLAVGPVRARFGGAAVLTYDKTTRSGTVRGSGQDSGSMLQAQAQFAVHPEGEGSVLTVVVEYGLRGALAPWRVGGWWSC